VPHPESAIIMPAFISYSQNAEDVLLWRALGHIKNGFYIDVGANDPDADSVTKAFYEQGWWGVNLEPLPHFHQALLAKRPRDVNLAQACAASPGELTLYDVADRSGWATLDAGIAEKHRADGHPVRQHQVPVTTLAAVCASHTRGDIHFLKVDVEGFEEQVLRGMDFARWQPWVVVVEATLPNSRETNHQHWEPLLLQHGYQFCYFDGLNRYYTSPAHPELQAALSVQANVFDQYQHAHLVHVTATYERCAQQLEESRGREQQQAAQAEQMRQQLEEAHQQLVRAMQAIEYEQVERQQINAIAYGERDAAFAERDAMFIARNAMAAERDAATLQCDIYQLHNDRLQRQVRRRREVLHQTLLEMAQARHQSQAAMEQLVATQNWAQHLQQLSKDLQNKLDATHASTSWRVTAPVRSLQRFLQRCRARLHQSWLLLKEGTFFARLGRLLKFQLLRLFSHEALRHTVVRILLRLPLLDQYANRLLKRVQAAQAPKIPEPSATNLPLPLQQMSPAVRKIFADLERAQSRPPVN